MESATSSAGASAAAHATEQGAECGWHAQEFQRDTGSPWLLRGHNRLQEVGQAGAPDHRDEAASSSAA